MAALTPAILQALNTGFRREFQQAQSQAKSEYKKVATVVPSSTKSNTYGWIGKMPNFREWIGDRVVNDIASYGYTIENKDFEMTIGVNRNDIEDDQIGVYSPLFQEMGRATEVHPDELVFGLLKAGDSTLCYDGQNFFDTDHPVYANHDGTGAVTTVSNIDSDPTDTGDAWFLLDTSRAIKPIIHQVRKKPQFTPMTSLTDESVFMRKEFRWGVDSRCNVRFGLWQMARMSTKAINAANLNAGIAAMQNLKGDGGRPLGLSPTLLVCSPSRREEALETVKAERDASGATNVNRNAVEVLVSPWLA